jgi:hypothetical protein
MIYRHCRRISKPRAIYGTLQQCYIESVVTHSVYSVHRHIYLLYNTPIALLQYSHSSTAVLPQNYILLVVGLHRGSQAIAYWTSSLPSQSRTNYN